MHDKKVESLLKPFEFVDYKTTLYHIVKNVNWRQHSSVAVLDEDKHAFGIITEEDIVKAEEKEVNFKSTQAWEICSHRLISIESSKPIKDAIALMVEKNIHHLAVLDEGQLVGIISSLDILRNQIAE